MPGESSPLLCLPALRSLIQISPSLLAQRTGEKGLPGLLLPSLRIYTHHDEP